MMRQHPAQTLSPAAPGQIAVKNSHSSAQGDRRHPPSTWRQRRSGVLSAANPRQARIGRQQPSTNWRYHEALATGGNVRELETERLLLRQWKDSDYPAFARMSADAETMRYFPSVLTDAQSRDIADRCRELIDQRGWGFWAVEVKASNEFAGFIGLHVPSAELPFSPCVEIGWRLARDFWGQGLATEGAQAALDFAFHELSLAEVVAFTTLSNSRSQRVMQRLGMVRSEKTFEHPGLPEGHELRQHVLYRKRSDA